VAEVLHDKSLDNGRLSCAAKVPVIAEGDDGSREQITLVCRLAIRLGNPTKGTASQPAQESMIST
jgi:hypothetical protein